MMTTHVPEEILVIDDHEETRLLARRILEGSGYSVSECAGVKEGLSRARESAPHLIILDLVLAGESGIDFLKRRKAIAELAAVPVLVLSGVSSRPVVLRAFELGAGQYLTKPFGTRDLLNKVKTGLRARGAPFVKFAGAERPTVGAQVRGRIVMAGEGGFLLEAPARFAPEQPAEVQAPILEEVGCRTFVFRKDPGRDQRPPPGQHYSLFSAYGLSAPMVDRIRQAVRGWKEEA